MSEDTEEELNAVEAQIVDEVEQLATIMDEIRLTEKAKLTKVCADIKKSIDECGEFPTFGVLHVSAWLLANLRMMIPDPPVPASMFVVLAAQMEAIERFMTPPDGTSTH